jgi:surface polysaccharide O-acyltransferase-like enzyme
MITMAPSAYCRGNLAIDLCSYFAVVLVVATVCLGFAAVFLRFGHARSTLTDSLSDNAYAIYLVHYVFVVWLQYALLGAALPAVAKGVLVFAGALLLSWGVAIGSDRLGAVLAQVRAAPANLGWRSAN